MSTEQNTDAERIDHWNYRVLHRLVPIADTGDYDETFELIEAYYDADGRIVAWGEDVRALGNSAKELADELRRMSRVADLASLSGPEHRALTLDDLPSGVGSE